MSQKFPVFVVSISSFLQEYLTSSMAVPSYQVISHKAHGDMVRMCVRYVLAILKEQSTHGEVLPLESFPMLSYVLSSGFNHIAHINPGSTVVLKALECLGSDVHHYPSHWDCLCELCDGDL